MTTRTGRLSGGKSRPRRSLRRRGALRAAAARRRGVLLLVVLSMLVLFLLLGTAFVVSTKQDERTMKAQAAAARVATAAASEGNLLDEVLAQLVRDTKNVHSSLRSHSLLADMYGNDGFTATLGQWPGNPPMLPVDWAGGDYARTGGQLIDLALGVNAAVTPNLPLAFTQYDKTNPTTLSHLDDAYAGQVLTFLNGKAAGISTRIVRYAPATYDNNGAVVTPPRLTVLEFKLADGRNLATATNNGAIPLGVALAPSADLPLRVLVNGKPFSGTGVGYDPTHAPAANEPRGDAMELVAGVARPLALLPNVAYFNPTGALNLIRLNNLGANNGTGEAYFPKNGLLPDNTPTYAIDYAGRGGANESYDAPDFQNMFLAAMDLPDDGRLRESVGFNSAALNDMVLPSFHRPALLNYWKSQASSRSPFASNPLHLRKVLLRPNWLDHPNFTGSNPEYEAAKSVHANALNRMIYGPWDVDNDLDGVRDSVWVDFGVPVMQGVDGKRYKALAAILCLDLDGRANVNAAGSLDLQAGSDGVATGDYSLTTKGVGPRPIDVNSNETTNFYPRGIGMGPAEIDLRPVLGPNSFRKVLTGDSISNNGVSTAIPGRYGYDAKPGRVESSGVQQLDPLAQVTLQDWPGRNPNARIQFGSFGQIPDHSARYTFGVNRFGQAVFDAVEATNDVRQLTGGSPYETNLAYEATAGAAPQSGVSPDLVPADMPYSVFELERVLRLYDADASGLPNRLAHLSGVQELNGNLDRPARTRITTESFDLSVPAVTVPANMRTLLATQAEADTAAAGAGAVRAVQVRPPRSVAELVEMRIRAAVVDPQTWPNGILRTQLPKWPLPISSDYGYTQDDANRLRTVLRQLIAPEVLAGGKLNLNRPLGNGIHDNGNGVIDEPFEENGNGVQPLWPDVSAAVAAASYRMTPANFPGGFDYYLNDNGTPANPADDFIGVVTADPRQLLARHLYVLALTAAARPDYLKGTDATMIRADRELARRLAQWAINVVDFRDPDNIMTPFKYDVNPFDGWSVDENIGNTADICGPDGVVRSERLQANGSVTGSFDDWGGVVWGAEQPELVITETLAWHDRRTDDGASENPYPTSERANAMKGVDAQNNPDTDFDQVVRPKGALFVELYNPGAANPAANADTHLLDTNGPNGSIRDLGINLAATTNALNNVPASPVWRLMIHKRTPAERFGPAEFETASQWDPDDSRAAPSGLSDLPRNFSDPLIANDAYTLADLSVRSVYFAGFDPEQPRSAAGLKWDRDGVAFFNDTRNPVLPVRPGRYMVVGSGEPVTARGLPSPFSADLANGLELPNYTGHFLAPLGDRKNRGTPARHRGILLHATGTGRVGMVDSDHLAFFDMQRNFRVSSPDTTAAPRMLQSAGVGNLPTDYDPASDSLTDVAIIDHVWDYVDNITYYKQRLPAGRRPPIAQYEERRVRYRRLTLSEPAHGYAYQFNGSIWDTVKQQYVKSAGRGRIDNDQYGVAAIDIPLDGPIGGALAMTEEARSNPPEYLLDPTRRDGRTTNIDPVLAAPGQPRQQRRQDPGASHSLIYLQRLANPLFPWNPEPAAGADPTINGHNPAIPVNPYLTLDSSSANLTVFNSRGSQSSTALNVEEDGLSANAVLAFFSSQERGYTAQSKAAQVANAPMASFAGREPLSLDRDRPPGLNLAGKRVPLNQYDAGKMPVKEQDSFAMNRVPYNSLGFLNGTYQDPNLANVQKQTQPRQPFEWFAWNNRPYVSANELLLVPRVPSSQMLRQFTSRIPQATGQTAAQASLYATQHGLATGANAPPLPFGHLENLFFDRGTLQSQNAQSAAVASGLFRVLEYVDVPSPFVGTSTWLNPSVFAARYDTNTGTLVNALNTTLTATDPESAFMPPYNSISEHRDPGRINLNTIGARAVYGALFHGEGNKVQPIGQPLTAQDGRIHPGPEWSVFTTSRRGYGSGNTPFTFQAEMPTFFANPFRIADSADLVPLAGMRPARHVDVTMLRGRSIGANDAPPLFAAAEDQNNANGEGRDTLRHAAYRYQPLTRLNKLTTTRSNCYAVWVTIGFFEVDEAPTLAQFTSSNGLGNLPVEERTAHYRRVYPDGVQFGREIGLDTGEVRRLRGFYVIDRSRPAAFEPGVDHNVENVVRLKRRIE